MIKLRKIPGSHPKSNAGIVIEREGQQSLIITPITINQNPLGRPYDDNGNIIKPK